MLNLFGKPNIMTDPFSSHLYDEKGFYKEFIKDVKSAKSEVIIESPFATDKRAKQFYPIFENLLNHGVKIYVIMRDPRIIDEPYSSQSETVVRNFEILGVQSIVTTTQYHRKLAIIDREILWEGSLNILSQSNSREIMRRIEGKKYAVEMFNFLKLGKYI